MFLTFHYNSPISITYHSPRISIAEPGAASTSTPCISTEAVMVSRRMDAGDDWWRMCQQRAPGTHCTSHRGRPGPRQQHAASTIPSPPPTATWSQHHIPSLQRSHLWTLEQTISSNDQDRGENASNPCEDLCDHYAGPSV